MSQPCAELLVYIQAGCLVCERARRLAAEAAEGFPELSVRVIDIARAAAGEEVFAVPTFVLNGRVFSLGNPDGAELCQAIALELQE